MSKAAEIMDPYLQKAAQHTHIPAIPATYYNLLSFKQKAIIPNYFMRDGGFTVKLFKTQYLVSWPAIVDHCKADRELAAWALPILPTLQFIHNEAHITMYDCIRCAFSHFESYRRHVSSIGNLSLQVAGDARLCSKYTWDNIYGWHLKNVNLSFHCTTNDAKEALIYGLSSLVDVM